VQEEISVNTTVQIIAVYSPASIELHVTDTNGTRTVPLGVDDSLRLNLNGEDLVLALTVEGRRKPEPPAPDGDWPEEIS
jgi:hypothetical protein